MSAGILLVLTIVAVITGLWLVVRIWQSSPVGAILTFFTGLPAWYFLFKYWNDEDRDIRVPFFVNLGIFIVYLVAALNSIEVIKELGEDDEAPRAELVRSKSNPEMEQWCREKHEAVYDHALGTCVEPEPGQQVAASRDPSDVMEQLGRHFSASGMTASLAKVDSTTPGASKLSGMPGMSRMMQFEFKSKSFAPTVVMVGECASVEECSLIEKRLEQPDAPFAVASNGKLVFLGFHVMGDVGKIEQAKTLFQSFKAKT